MCNANNFGRGVQITQNFIQHVKPIELLAAVTQHFLLEANFTQHRKCQCWVTQHSVQRVQPLTLYQCWVNVGVSVG